MSAIEDHNALQRSATKVAALYDIHGNLPALDAVLEDIRDMHVDAIVIGGDIVLGPMPTEVLERLRALPEPLHYIRGNCDRLVVAAFDGALQDNLPAAVRETIEWTAAQIDHEQRDLLASLPMTLAMKVAGVGDVLFCHATPRSDEEIFGMITPPERVRPMLAAQRPALLVCGHTHIQFDRLIDDVRIANAGSVGMPIASQRAQWLLLGPAVQLTSTPYDGAAAGEQVRRTGYPRPGEYLDRSGFWNALQSTEQRSAAEIASVVLASLRDQDWRDHSAVAMVGTREYRDLRQRDQARRQRATEALDMIDSHGEPTAEDLYNVAWLFNHGDLPHEAKRAHQLALAAAERGHGQARWLAAVAYDRWCMYEGRAQKYGTQFVPDGVGYRLWDYDPATSDDERAAWNVPPLADQLRRAETMSAAEPQPPMAEAPPWLKAAIERWQESS